MSKKDYEPAVSILTYAELYAGRSVWEKPSAATELEVIFSGICLIPLTEEISRRAGEIRASYKLDLIDAIIAATALDKNLPLLTLNKKHFQQISGLKVENPL